MHLLSRSAITLILLAIQTVAAAQSVSETKTEISLADGLVVILTDQSLSIAVLESTFGFKYLLTSDLPPSTLPIKLWKSGVSRLIDCSIG